MVRDIWSPYIRLGLTSFGGPIAHLAYFRKELVEKRGWVTESQFAQLIGLTQFLPGPASSQLGFCLGLIRGGWLGGLLAFLAFTIPSAVAMVGFALLLPSLAGEVGQAVIHGLKLVAVPVVAHGLWKMARRLCPDLARQAIAAVVAATLIMVGSAWMQLGVVLGGALAGLVLCRQVSVVAGDAFDVRYGSRTGAALLVVVGVVLLGTTVVVVEQGALADLAVRFYRAGALVFGGGHVVLPLLEEMVVEPGLVSSGDFLAGYGAAQAVPGPMFSFAAFLGARASVSGPVLGALVATAAIFLPGFLLAAGCLPLWNSVASKPWAAAAVAGVNAAVVGLLAAALYDPVWTGAVVGPFDVVIALACLALMATGRVSALVVVGICVAASVGVGLV